MDKKMLLFLIGTWFLFMILAIINAGLRNNIYRPMIGELRAHQLSTIIFIALIFIVTYIIMQLSTISLTSSEAFLIGILWMLFTISFEFIAGHYLFGNSWNKLLGDYNILTGRIWIFVLLTLIFTPYIVNKIR
jgi:hypothetical protein